MKNKIRNFFPGGNTPDGFYSYYNYILPQSEAKKIFCIKGGPGTGKSTMMGNIGKHFMKKGEDVDFLWCSSDPDSLDGVLLKSRNIAIVDGTAPHIVDPKNPGAVDEIIDIGKYWNEKELRKNRNDIIKCSQEVSRLFQYAYGYLKCAREKYIFMSQIFDNIFSQEAMKEYRNQIHLKLDGLTMVRRAESKVRKDMVLGRRSFSGSKRKAFASAITPFGIRNHINSIIEHMDRVVIIFTPVGFRTERLLDSVACRLIDAGLDIEEYYSPMFPDSRVEHIICPEAGLAVVCANKYNEIDESRLSGKIMNINIADDLQDEAADVSEELLEYLNRYSLEEIMLAVDMLGKAKARHDILEQYYVCNMDFDAVRKKEKHIITEIEELE